MTELVLKNRVSKQKLDSIIYFLKILNVEVEIKKSIQKKDTKKNLFAETFGMWADRDIDIKKMRKESYERRTKYYDNATL